MPEIELNSGQTLVVTRGGTSDEVVVLGADGGAMVTIEVTRDAATVRVAAPRLRLEAEQRIELAAREIALEASESLELRSDGAAVLDATGMLETRGHAQLIRSELGDVRIDANDDVRIDGERVMVNCDQVK